MTYTGCNHHWEQDFTYIFHRRPFIKKFCWPCGAIEFEFFDGQSCQHLFEEMSLEISEKLTIRDKIIDRLTGLKKILYEPENPLPMRRCVHCGGIVIGQTMSKDELRRRAQKMENYHNSKPGPKVKRRESA